ncbi:hypothetical protein CY35_12G030600 [Sphagnum magellanicum]|nr:hypothetical protein CY35_12G030600 [Sphagnum magellanicum]
MATTTTTMVREKNTADRELGKSETNWIAAVETGTGITLLGLLFARRFTRSSLTTSLRQLLASHPRLRSHISKQLNGKNFIFTTSTADHAAEDPVVSQISVISRAADDDEEELEDDDESEEASKEKWLKLLEDEMNTPFPKEKPFAVFDMKVYELPENSSLVVFRFHSAAADVASTSPVARQFVDLLYRQVQLEEQEEEEDATAQKKKKQTTWESSESAAAEGGQEEEEEEEEEVEDIELPALEKAIPQGQAQKPFWAHGVDTLGYGIVSRKHAYLPFDHTNKPRKSRLIRASLSPKATDDLLQACKKNNSLLYGAIEAAGLKAAADMKKVGKRGEHYGTVVLLNCRNLLEPRILESHVGFYHAAMMKTIHVSETESFWEVAEKCTTKYNEAVKAKKHFMDMGDLNALMVQGMRFPNLTPSGSLRSTLLSLTAEPLYQDLGPSAMHLNLKDHLVCTSNHGIGSCLAIFYFIRDAKLEFSFIYASPLFTRPKMQDLVNSILSYLTIE